MSEEIMKKLKEHDARFDAHDARFDAIGRKLNEHDEQLDLIARTVVDHTERFERIESKLDNVVTKEDLKQHTDAVDDMVRLYRKKDDELTFMSKHVQRIEEDVKKMKPMLGLT